MIVNPMSPFSACIAAMVLAMVLFVTLLAAAGQTLAQDDPNRLPPHIIEIIPYPGEEVPVDQPVIIVFDQAMDQASVEATWEMTPTAQGTFSWADEQTLAFIPTGGWQRATRYTVSINTTARAANGLALEESYAFFVQTIGYLEVSTVIPADKAEGVAADATIAVSFNRPVVPLVSTGELDQLPHPLTFDPPIEGTGEWVNTSIYVFTPGKPLAGGTTYKVSIPAGLSDVLGATLDETFSWQFKTLPPEILNVSPSQNQTNVRLETPVTVQFSQPMDRPSTEEAFMLLHGGERVAGSFTWTDDSRHLWQAHSHGQTTAGT